MSIVVTVRVGEGLVVAADSASTLNAALPTGQSGVAKVFNNASKLVQLRDYPIAVASWGIGSIGSRTISSLVAEYANERQPLADREDDPLSVESEARELQDFFFEAYGREFPDWEQQPEEQRPGLGVFVGGYSGTGFFPDEFAFNIPAREFVRKREPRDNGTQNFGADWFGLTDALVRFHHGRDDRIAEILSRHNVGDVQCQAVLDTLKREVQYPVPFDGMPLQDAVDYSIFMVSLAVGRYRFCMGAELCGGPIDVAAVTREQGFTWVQRKELRILH